jgi:hypothetical protein
MTKPEPALPSACPASREADVAQARRDFGDALQLLRAERSLGTLRRARMLMEALPLPPPSSLAALVLGKAAA